MATENKKIVTGLVVASISVLTFIATHLLPNRTNVGENPHTVTAQGVIENTVRAIGSVPYTPYEESVRQTSNTTTSGTDIFNKRFPAVVVNQWRADTPANTRACSTEWKSLEAYATMCSSLINTMIIAVEIDSDHAIKKVFVPVPLENSLSIGDKVMVATGNFDAPHEKAFLPSIVKVVDSNLYELPAI